MKKTFVYTTFQKEGYHAFPEAGTEAAYASGDYLDVSHLATRHMHYFNYKVWVEVKHANRSIEFIQLRRWIEARFADGALELNSKSCEMLADDMISLLQSRYGFDVAIRVDVSEEGINGSLVEYTPDA